jgi:hypothetical protein
MQLRQDALLAMLAETGLPAAALTLAPGVDLIASAWGGRLYGPFIDGQDRIGWVSPAFGSVASVKALAASDGWNIGGQRNWLSPELDFLVGDRDRFWESFAVPDTVDPGRHALAASDGLLSLGQQVTLAGLSAAISRTVRPLPVEPVAGAADLRAAAYRHGVDIVSSDACRPVVPWIVAQVEPGGTAIVPADPGCIAAAMFGDPPAAIMRARRGAVRVSITAEATFKLAVPARLAHGLLGYVFPLGEEAMLQVYRFSHDRDGTYHDEPPDRPGLNGFSTFIFQDDGSMGSYGELEMVGIDLGAGPDGGRHARLEIDVETFVGRPDDIERAAIDRLGVSAR